MLRSPSWKGPQLGPRGLPAERSPGRGSLKGSLGQLDKFSGPEQTSPILAWNPQEAV